LRAHEDRFQNGVLERLPPATHKRSNAPREAVEQINEARELGELRKYGALLKSAELLIIDIDDLLLSKARPTPAMNNARRSRHSGSAGVG
jgi:hypothetical protein